MNRRQFIKRAGVLLGALLARAGDLLRGGTKPEGGEWQFSDNEMPVSLGNRSVFAPLWDDYGIKASDVQAQIEIARNLDDGQSVAERLDQFGQALAAQKVERTRLSEYFPHRPVKEDMARILADNPRMSREDAFLQAVFERAEDAL